MNNLTLLTYTNSNAQDIHSLYFNRVKKYFSSIKNVVAASDEDISGINTILYKNDQPYFEQICNTLDKITTEYILYNQEDYILFDYVDTEKIQETIGTLAKNNNVAFVRLIQSATQNSVQVNENYLQLDKNHQYFYSAQAAVWRKTDLKDMFLASKAQSIRDEPQNSSFLKRLNKYGLCVTGRGRKIGDHFNSLVYPYIATAVVGGKWNCSEYEEELSELFEEYSINKNIRGTR
jgi:hypothetical protein